MPAPMRKSTTTTMPICHGRYNIPALFKVSPRVWLPCYNPTYPTITTSRDTLARGTSMTNSKYKQRMQRYNPNARPPQKIEEEKKIAHNDLENRSTPDESVAISRKSPPELSCPKVCRPTRARVYSGIMNVSIRLSVDFEGTEYGVQVAVIFSRLRTPFCFPLTSSIGNRRPGLILHRFGGEWNIDALMCLHH